MVTLTDNIFITISSRTRMVVTVDFVAKLRGLDAKNSQGELSIEKFLTKNEEAFFDKVKEDRRSSAASLRSQRDSYYHPNPSRSSLHSTRPDCKCPLLLIVPLCSWFCCSSVV